MGDDEYTHQDFAVAALARDTTLGELARIWPAVASNQGARIVVLVPRGGRPNPALGEGQILTRKTQVRQAHPDWPAADAPRFPHDYPGAPGYNPKDPGECYTSDCRYGCGCWAGPSRSGGPEGVDPFGECPKHKEAGK